MPLLLSIFLFYWWGNRGSKRLPNPPTFKPVSVFIACWAEFSNGFKCVSLCLSRLVGQSFAGKTGKSSTVNWTAKFSPGNFWVVSYMVCYNSHFFLGEETKNLRSEAVSPRSQRCEGRSMELKPDTSYPTSLHYTKAASAGLKRTTLQCTTVIGTKAIVALSIIS